ncbi:MAG: DUF4391 domain-containing protein [Anaerolineaceae bacterium]|nr:DUF4391 domain-containing protein [Anaerolineaceae bacterium]
MLDLPKSTEFNRRIPKQKFYENLDVTPAQKRIFIDQINTIWWRNKIAPATMNLAAGESVTEIEVFEVKLSVPQLDESVLRLIDRKIPYHILFLLEHEGKYQAWTAYKEATISGRNAFKVGMYYHTEWAEESGLPLRLEGLKMDQVYENFVRQIAGEVLNAENEESLKELVERDAEREKLEKQIAAFQAKIRKEKQLNKQVEMNTELKKLKRQIAQEEK